MEDAVSSAASMVGHGSDALQVVLLSPGASAFEYFDNEYRRGDSFKDAIASLS